MGTCKRGGGADTNESLQPVGQLVFASTHRSDQDRRNPPVKKPAMNRQVISLAASGRPAMRCLTISLAASGRPAMRCLLAASGRPAMRRLLAASGKPAMRCLLAASGETGLLPTQAKLIHGWNPVVHCLTKPPQAKLMTNLVRNPHTKPVNVLFFTIAKAHG